MLGLLNTVSKIFLLFNGCLSDTTKSYDDSYSQDYVLEDNYGLTDIQWLRFGGEYDEDNEWKVYEESSGKLLNFNGIGSFVFLLYFRYCESKILKPIYISRI